MAWLFLIVVPVMFFAGLDMLCGGEPPRSVRWLARRLGALRRGVCRGLAAARPRGVAVDVFDTLHLQSRLGALADEIRVLESDRLVYAKAHRLRATHRAYDDLLAEACRLAGVGVAADGLRDGGRTGGRVRDDARLEAELELASRGWSW